MTRHVQDSVWPRRGLAGWAGWLALRPFASLFGAGVQARDLAYRVGILRGKCAPLAVVSVGNLTVGGTGKTPITLWLAGKLMDRGLRPAILLRGYRGRSHGVTEVSLGQGLQASVEQVGDEAIMLARRFPGTVLTACRRIEGARRAAELGCNVIVLDDGFQHRALARDFDIVLLDGQHEALLPSGPCREPVTALRRADAIVVVTPEGQHAASPPASAARKPIFHGRVTPCHLVVSEAGQWHERSLAEIAGRRIAAIAGIASPNRFYALLHQWEAELAEIIEFPDHHPYGPSDWREIARRTRSVDMIVTTEKDLVKLEAFPFARGKLVALRVGAEIERGEELVEMVLARAGTLPSDGVGRPASKGDTKSSN